MNKLRTVDLVFATTALSDGEMRDPKPAREEREVYGSVRIGLRSNELWKAVLTACEPPGFSYDLPSLGPGQLYTLWNDNPADSTGFNWDPDQRLETAVVLSRLIHPTSIGFKYSARVIFDHANGIKQIIPGPVSGLPHAYVITSTAPRDWLTDNEVSVLRSLLADFYAISSANLPSRIQRALWNYVYAFEVRWIDIRWTVVATALESLVHTDRNRSTKQFIDRVTALANRVGVSFSLGDAERAYDLRSSLAHGQELGTGDDATTALYCRMEEVLRASVCLAIQDAAFRDIFRTDDQIRVAFPLLP